MLELATLPRAMTNTVDGPGPVDLTGRNAPLRLSVIVPVYNERDTVAEILRRMKAVPLPVDLEIIAVNDASTDGTREVLDAMRSVGVRVLHHPFNRGKGAAIRTGLEAVTGDLVLIQDADLEYDPNDWPSLLAPVLAGETKVVYGSRFAGSNENM